MLEPLEVVVDVIDTEKGRELENLDSRGAADLSPALEQWAPGDTAAILEGLPHEARGAVWDAASEEIRGEILAHLGDPVRAALLQQVGVAQAAAATIIMDAPDVAAVVDEAPTELREAILESLGAAKRAEVEDALGCPSDTAGRLMERDWVAVRADVRLEVVSRYLQYRGDVPHHTTALMVVDRDGVFLGKLALAVLLTKHPQRTVAEVMDRGALAVDRLTPLDDVADLFKRRDLVDLPVLDDARRLIGRIILDDAIELIRAKAERPMMQMAGLEANEDLLAPIGASARRRSLWLGINLATAFLAAWVIGLFEATIKEIVALAVLMPIVASMGGIAGSQTLTLAIRGLALGHITDANRAWLARKEVVIAVISGILWSLVVGVIAWVWFGHIGIAAVLGIAMIVNLLAAAVAGLAVPLILKRLGQDPALSGSVILTTVTDVVRFVTFLGLATLFLL